MSSSDSGAHSDSIIRHGQLKMELVLLALEEATQFIAKTYFKAGKSIEV